MAYEQQMYFPQAGGCGAESKVLDGPVLPRTLFGAADCWLPLVSSGVEKSSASNLGSS